MTQPYPPPYQPGPAKRPGRWRLPLAIAAGVVVLFGAAFGITAALDGGASASPCAQAEQQPPCFGPNHQWISVDNAAAAASSTPTYGYTAPATTRPASPPLTAGDFTIGLKTVSKQCFGSYGCSMVVEPTITYNGTADQIVAYGTCDITYTITGNKDGDVVDTAYGEGDTQFRVTRSVLETASTKVNPTASVTSVSCS